MYVDASNGKEGDRAIFVSPMINMTNDGCLTFAYHIVGEHAGSLDVYAMHEFKEFHR